MSEQRSSFHLQKDCKNCSKTANEWYLASALYDGVEDGNLRQLTTLLVNKGANPNIVLPEYGVAPIHLAAGLEDLEFGCEATKLFLCHGGDPNILSSDGLTPVHIASLWGRTAVLQLLLANGGDPWLLDSENKNAFCHAHEQEQWEAFKLLDSFKNKIILERPEVSQETHCKLRLDRVKIFTNDICAEYRAVPTSLKCCSTQTPPLTLRKTASVSSDDSEQGTKVEKKTEGIPCPPEIDVMFNESYEHLDDTFNMKFNLCPNSQELQALELVRKHRQGITVFEYVPESGYHGDNENISVYQEDASRYSVDNDNRSLAGSLNSLVRGSVFADVKSKLKLFYKNVSSGNGNKDCSWRLNLIQKRKDKEKLKKEAKDSIKTNSSSAVIKGKINKKKFKETRSDITNLRSKNSSRVMKRDAGCVSVSNDNKYDDSGSEIESNCSKNSLSSLWKCKITGNHKKTNTHKNDSSDSYLDSFHRFEDVIDSYNFDEINKYENSEESSKLNISSDTGCNKVKSSENTGKCVCESICMELVQKINSQNYNNNNNNGNNSKEIGFVTNEDNNVNHTVVSESVLVCKNKKEIGFCFDEPLKSVSNPVQEIKKSDVKSSNVNDLCFSTPDSESKIPQQKENVGYDNTCYKTAQFVNSNSDNSMLLTDDEGMTSNAFVCFKTNSSLDKNTTNNSSINNSNLNSTKTSATDIYFSCTSADHTKENSDNKGNLTDKNECDSKTILESNSLLFEKSSISSNNINQKHIEGICIYESDHSDKNFAENEKDTQEILNTGFQDSECVRSSTPELVYETDCFDSMTAVLGSPKPSLSDNCFTKSVSSNRINICYPNSSSGDCNLSLPGPSRIESAETVPNIKIPHDVSSCSEENVGKFSCHRTYSSQLPEQKWTYADIISSDDETDVSIVEEYLYTDEEDGIELVEERHLPARRSKEIIEQMECDRQNQRPEDNQLVQKKATSTDAVVKKTATTETESESALSSVDTAYETDALRRELRDVGLQAGPITGGTKRVYLRQLKRARRKPVVVPTLSSRREYSPELERLLRTENKDLIDIWSYLEVEMSQPFQFPDPSKRWREGVAKTSFTYLLLDPRVTQDLPYRANSLSPKERLNCFLQAIFYVGRGKRARPYSHLTEALVVWNQWKHVSSKKIKKIHDIWRSGLGVVCLHVFQNVIPVEAMTREAAMIDALGLQVLCNERVGDYYAAAATWNLRQRQQLGAVLLVRALSVLIGEGERQIRPPDIEQ